ncbi:M56 family metallopeptidase [Brevibacillus panacihumi]|uniref:M56 family metallopeptidase n=1 Tax=Brevibacillus panacihumi TaxID=497735 RepID=UPI003D1B3A7B
MMAFLLSLILASVVGTIMWMLQNAIRPLTNKLFSQTWHYYTGLIPVCFLLGGSAIINGLVQFSRVLLPDTGTTPLTAVMAEPIVNVLPLEHAVSNRTFLDQLFANLLRLEHLQKIVFTAILIWAAGTIVFLAVNVRNYRAFKRSILQNSRVSETVNCPVNVIVSACARTPMVMGLWKPFVVLPDTPVGEKELAMILSHELVHLQRGDLLIKLVILLANAVHWFNPAVYLLNKQLNTLCELSCDEKVVRDMDARSRRLYGETLLTVLEYGVMQRNVICTTSFCNSKKIMKDRLANLMNAKKTHKSIMLLSLVATISMAGFGGLVAFAAGSAMPNRAVSPEIPTGKELQGRNVYLQLEDGTVFYYDKDGNATEVPEMRKRVSPPEYTTEELVDQIKQWIKDQSPVPQDTVDKLPQEYLDEINQTYGLQLKRTDRFTIEELVELTKKGIEKNTVPQAYVDVLPQKELDEINKTYGWELQKSNERMGES